MMNALNNFHGRSWPSEAYTSHLHPFIAFNLRKADAVTGAPVAGAVFELRGGGESRTAQSDDLGRVCFHIRPLRTYLLREAVPPTGYDPLPREFAIMADPQGCVYVDGEYRPCFSIVNQPSSGLASFTALKLDLESGLPLSGAEYTLFRGSQPVALSVSNSVGELIFVGLQPGAYALFETSAPPGYQGVTASLPLAVTPDGSVTIDGLPAQFYSLYNVLLSHFAFLKHDGSTGLPLSGAAFTLYQSGIALQSITSDVNGLVNFGLLPPGGYTLSETTPPAGFPPNPQIYSVIVTGSGTVTVDGLDISLFVVENIPSPPT